MTSLFVIVAASALGIDVGWEPLDEGGHEYTIQLEPQLIDRLKQGDGDIVSDVPPQLDVRRYRITVGTAKLPRVDGPAKPAAAPAAAPSDPIHTPSLPAHAPDQPTPAAPPSGGAQPPAHPADFPAASAGPGQPGEPAPHLAAEPTPALAEEPPNPFAPSAPSEPPQGTEVQAKRPRHGPPEEETAAPPAIPATLPAEHDSPQPIHSAAFNALDEPAPGHAPHDATKPDAHETAKSDAHGAAKAAPHDAHAASAKSTVKTDVPAAVKTEARGAKAAEPGRPWMPFFAAFVLLCGSLGGNIYLGWIAWDARGRYREAVAKFRAAPAA